MGDRIKLKERKSVWETTAGKAKTFANFAVIFFDFLEWTLLKKKLPLPPPVYQHIKNFFQAKLIFLHFVLKKIVSLHIE